MPAGRDRERPAQLPSFDDARQPPEFGHRPATLHRPSRSRLPRPRCREDRVRVFDRECKKLLDETVLARREGALGDFAVQWRRHTDPDGVRPPGLQAPRRESPAARRPRSRQRARPARRFVRTSLSTCSAVAERGVVSGVSRPHEARADDRDVHVSGAGQALPDGPSPKRNRRNDHRLEGYTLTTRSNSARSCTRASSGGVSQRALSHSRSAPVAPRATAQPFEMSADGGIWLSTSFCRRPSRRWDADPPRARLPSRGHTSPAPSPTSTTAHSCPWSTEPLAAMWTGSDALVGSAAPAVASRIFTG